MAKKAKAPEKKLERVYNIPLRREWLKTPKYRRAKKAVTGVKNFIAQHMKIDMPNIKIGPQLNKKLWEHGMRNPPHHVKITAIKETFEDKDVVKVELEGVEFKTISQKAKVEKSPGLRGKLEKALGARKEEKEEKKGEKKVELEELAEPKEEKKLEEKKEKDKILKEEPKPVPKEAPKPHLEPGHEAERTKKLERSKA